MIVFNLTDVPSKGARARGWVKTHLRIGQVTIAPGASADVSKHFLQQVKEYEMAGAVAIGTAPAWYSAAKVVQTPAPVKVEAPKAPESVSLQPTVVPSSVDPIADTEPSEGIQEDDKSRHSGRRRSRGG